MEKKRKERKRKEINRVYLCETKVKSVIIYKQYHDLPRKSKIIN